MKLAKKFDDFKYSDKRSHIKTTIKSFLNSLSDNSIEVKQDVLEIDLTDNFNSNLKAVRNYRNITQIELSNTLDVSRPVVGMYESKNYPPIKTLIKLSQALNISIHALATGEKLCFNFKDEYFGKSVLLADKQLSFEHQKFIIELMENILKS